MVKLLVVSFICFLFMIGEFVGGYLSHSLAIMTDAAHMLSDVAGFMISYFAIQMASKPSSFNMSFGYHRAEILGALASIMLIWGLVIWLLIEAVGRLITPEIIDSEIMLITAVVGLICNIINIFTLHSCSSFCGGGDSHVDHHHVDHEHVEIGGGASSNSGGIRKLSHCH
jgi:zinc transporter 2